MLEPGETKPIAMVLTVVIIIIRGGCFEIPLAGGLPSSSKGKLGKLDGKTEEQSRKIVSLWLLLFRTCAVGPDFQYSISINYTKLCNI